MTQKELAQLLGISTGMVSRLVKRGMPTDSLERAKRWRKRHLEPGRVKGSRFDPNAQDITGHDSAVSEVERLSLVILPRLAEAGSDIDRESIMAPLRCAIRAVQGSARPRMPAFVWWGLLRWAVPGEAIDLLPDAPEQMLTPEELESYMSDPPELLRTEALRIAADVYGYALAPNEEMAA